MPLGAAKKPMMAFLAVFLFLAMVMPFFVLIMETFQITTGAGYGLDNLTLYNWIGEAGTAEKYTNYEGIFRNKEFFSALWNTIRLTIITSIITAFCGQFLGYISSRAAAKWYGNLTEQMVFVPYLMSGVAFSTMYFSMFSVPHFGGLIPSLYGTFTLIVLTSVVKHFPFASRSGTANMLSISMELEEAADIAGASFWKRMATIIRPPGEERLHLRFDAGLHLHCQGAGPDHHHDDAHHPDHVLSGLHLLPGGLRPDVRRHFRVRAAVHPVLLHLRQQGRRRGYRQELVNHGPHDMTERKER